MRPRCALQCSDRLISRGAQALDGKIQKGICLASSSLLLCMAFSMAWDDGYFDRWMPAACKKNAKVSDEEPLLSAEGDRTDYQSASADDDEEEIGFLKAAVRRLLVAFLRIGDRSQPDADSDGDGVEVDDVLIIAFLGSMDDFVVYLTFALAGVFRWYELLLGITLGAAVIALLVGTTLEWSKAASDFVSLIPLPLVFFLLAVYILVTGFVSLPAYF